MKTIAIMVLLAMLSMNAVADEYWGIDGPSMFTIPDVNVGIGTAIPEKKLHVVGDLRLETPYDPWSWVTQSDREIGDIIIDPFWGQTYPVRLEMISGYGYSSSISMTNLGDGASTWRIERDAANTNLNFREVFPYPPFESHALTLEHLTGYVGIDTNDPGAPLHVVGDVGEYRSLAIFANPNDVGTIELSMQGGTMLPWGWDLKATSGLFTIGSVMNWPPALNMTNTGYVGLSVESPTYRLELPNQKGYGGKGLATAWDTYSSRRWKTRIETIDGALDKVQRLRGVMFNWKDGGERDMGLIAEEVGEVIPEIVNFEEDQQNARSVTYDRLVALLIEAVKEQQQEIDGLKQQLQEQQDLSQRLDDLEALVAMQVDAMIRSR